ncbi:TetR family transcriptional regulator [Acuticoccus sediminis]|uniref:TetR family transcriptional regulator n=1 Tax=Acuticoccus sediminis TaxID=2184697 RepID=UPI001CFE45A6|nr:TetR family transcriptional regulator [Acuticoccus sediminis]
MAKSERRAAIVNAAVALVWDKGLGAATVRAVAAAVGASPGQIHHHFASVDDLRAEAFREASRRMLPELTRTLRSMPPMDNLLGLLAGCASEEHAMAERLWRDALAAARMSEIVGEAVREALDEWNVAIVDALKRVKEAGELPATLDEAPVAQRLMALSLGLDVLNEVYGRCDGRTGRQAVVRAALAIEAAALCQGGGRPVSRAG